MESTYFADTQVRHEVLVVPLQVRHDESQLKQTLVVVFSAVPLGQVDTHVFEDKKFGDAQLKQ